MPLRLLLARSPDPVFLVMPVPAVLLHPQKACDVLFLHMGEGLTFWPVEGCRLFMAASCMSTRYE